MSAHDTLRGLVTKALDDLYATENERMECAQCDAAQRRYRRHRIEELSAAANWLEATSTDRSAS